MNFAAALALVVAPIGAWIAVVYMRFRDARLTALVVLAPLLTLAALDRLVPSHAYAYERLAYVLAVVVGTIAVGRLVRGVCDGLPARQAARSGLRALSLGSGPAAAAFLLSPFLLMVVSSDRLASDLLVSLALDVLFALSGSLAAVAAAAFLPYTEEFVARANVLRERRERWFAGLGYLSERRWALSLSGVALVLVTLAVFGARRFSLTVDPSLPYVLALAAVLAFLGFALAALEGRLAVAMTLAAALAVVFVPAIAARAGAALDRYELIELAVVCATGSVPMSVLGSAWGRFMREGETVGTALARALIREGPDMSFAMLFALVPSLFVLSGRIFREPVFAVPVVFVTAVLIFFPAFAVALHALLPRRVSLDEAFRRK